MIIASVSLLAMILSACTTTVQTDTVTAAATELQATETVVSATPESTSTAVSEIQATVLPAGYDPKIANSWMKLPVIPETISDKMKAVYAAGQNGGGLNAKAFSKIGDCETSSDYFLKPFDYSTSGYSLGEYSELQGVIDHFSGSFEWTSLAAKPGFSISSVFSSLWADPNVCEANEWPIDCEIRLHKPAFALVMFGTNDVNNTRPTFKKNLEMLVDKLLKNDIVPILVTKADNLEKDNSINAIIAQVAYEKEVPLLNFWRAAQALPDQGLQSDRIHLTYAAPHFDDPEAMKAGWPWRNLTSLQALDAVWRGVGGDK
jgi:hypothetical protein